MFYFKGATPNPNQPKSNSPPKRIWWKWLFDRFTTESVTDEVTQDYSTCLEINPCQTEILDTKSCSSEKEISDWKRLDGG